MFTDNQRQPDPPCLNIQEQAMVDDYASEIASLGGIIDEYESRYGKNNTHDILLDSVYETLKMIESKAEDCKDLDELYNYLNDLIFKDVLNDCFDASRESLIETFEINL